MPVKIQILTLKIIEIRLFLKSIYSIIEYIRLILFSLNKNEYEYEYF